MSSHMSSALSSIVAGPEAGPEAAFASVTVLKQGRTPGLMMRATAGHNGRTPFAALTAMPAVKHLMRCLRNKRMQDQWCHMPLRSPPKQLGGAPAALPHLPGELGGSLLLPPQVPLQHLPMGHSQSRLLSVSQQLQLRPRLSLPARVAGRISSCC